MQTFRIPALVIIAAFCAALVTLTAWTAASLDKKADKADMLRVEMKIDRLVDYLLPPLPRRPNQ